MAKTYTELLTKRPLLEKVIADLHLKLTPDQLVDKISIVQPADTQLLELQVEDSDPQLAVNIANSLTSFFLIQHDRRRIDRSVYVEIVEPAALPAEKLRPLIFFNVLVAAIAGLTLALGFIFLLDYLDDTVTRSEGAEEVLQFPTLAPIPPVKRRALLKASRQGLPFTFFQPASPFAEAYRLLWINVQFANSDQTLKTLLVTSTLPNEGKTTTVANLGAVMAQSGLQVLLVDADLRRATLHQMFGLPNQRGLVNLLIEDVMPAESDLLELAVPNLRLLPSGSFGGDPILHTPSELFSLTRMRKFINHLSTLADVVLIDCPPVLAVTDAIALASCVDGVLVVVESSRTSKEDVRKALHNLQNAKAKVLGTILTHCNEGIGYYYGRYRAGLDKRGHKNASIPLPARKLVHSSSSDSRNGKVAVGGDE
jgi:capsular exopolysaccharide synthesis family protein